MFKISHRFSRRLSLYLCAVVAVFFVIATGVSIHQSVQQSSIEAEKNAFAQMDIISLRIELILKSVEAAVDNIAVDVEEELSALRPDAQRLYDITRTLVHENDFVVGSIISVPKYAISDEQCYFAAYSAKCLTTDTITTSQVGNDDYDYTTMDWYRIPYEQNRPYWSDPYFDEGAGNIIMCTYSKPLKGADGEFLGVLTADLPLYWLSDRVNEIKPYPSSYNIMVGKNGSYIVHTDSTRILRETIFSATSVMTDTTARHIGHEMVAGRRGSATFDNDGTKSLALYTPIPTTGWSLAMVCPYHDIYRGTHDMATILIVTLAMALLLIFLVLNFVIGRMTRPLRAFNCSARRIAAGDFRAPLPRIKSKDEMMQLRDSFRFMQTSLTDYINRLKETTSAKERIESELSIAREIQMSMIPKVFPPFPDRKDIDIYAFIQPAKEVGGDLYDFLLDGDKVYFIIGDVSGKGVPAALFMSVARSIFRSIATSMASPSAILHAMNNAMCDGNDANMFVTLFVGVVDLATKEITYSNAGHNPPVLIDNTGGVRLADVSKCSGIPVGVFANCPYTEATMSVAPGDRLLLYTDGLTEAENKSAELYGEERLMATLAREGFSSKGTRDLLESIFADVEAHVAGAQQSDDLTLMVMEFRETAEREPRGGTCTQVAPCYSPHHRKIELTNDIAQLAPMTAWLEAILEEHAVPPTLAMNINLAIEEAVTNVIMYAYPPGTTATFHIEFDMPEPNLATWCITDSGMPFDPTAKADADVTLNAEDRPIGGLGVFLVKEIMDRVIYVRKDGQNVLTMSMVLPSA